MDNNFQINAATLTPSRNNNKISKQKSRAIRKLVMNMNEDELIKFATNKIPIENQNDSELRYKMSQARIRLAKSGNYVYSNGKSDEILGWHHITGHAHSGPSMMAAKMAGISDNWDNAAKTFCKYCLVAKAERVPLPTQPIKRKYGPFECFQADISGKHIRSVENKQYCLCFIEHKM